MSHFPAVKLIDNLGAAQGVPFYGGSPSVVAQDYLLSMAEGDIAGHTPFSKLGYNDDVGSTEEDIWVLGGTYVFPASAIQMEVVSSSASDAAAGTGVRTVRIGYLDNTYAEKTETVTLNGVTPVNTVATNILRVNSIRAVTCGSGKTAAGTISVRSVGGATTYRVIAQGYTRGRSAIFTVPLGKTLYITSIGISSGATTASKVVRWTGRATYDELSGTVLDFFMANMEMQTRDQSLIRQFEMPIKIAATCDFKISAVSNTAGSACQVGIRGWLE